MRSKGAPRRKYWISYVPFVSILIAGIVARIKKGSRAGTVNIEHINPALLDDFVVGVQGHL